MMRQLLAALHLLPMIDPPEPSDPDDRATLIECPDGIIIYRGEDGAPLPGVEFDECGIPVAGGHLVECGRQLARNGACQRCGGRSWIPAAPPETTPGDLLARLEERKARNILRLVGGMD